MQSEGRFRPHRRVLHLTHVRGMSTAPGAVPNLYPFLGPLPTPWLLRTLRPLPPLRRSILCAPACRTANAWRGIGARRLAAAANTPTPSARALTLTLTPRPTRWRCLPPRRQSAPRPRPSCRRRKCAPSALAQAVRPRPSEREKRPSEHNVGISRNPRQDCGSASKTQCKCTCRRGSGPSAPARARFMGLIGCTRVLCRAVSWSSGMPDDNSEARALCARRQCSRAAGSQQSSRARSERSQRAALRPRPAWPAPPPSWPLLAVCAAAHTCRQEVLCALSRQYSAFPPACMHSGAGREITSYLVHRSSGMYASYNRGRPADSCDRLQTPDGI